MNRNGQKDSHNELAGPEPGPARSAPGARIGATLYTDPACPWGYSANPALRVLEWRYGDQLSWRLVMIGLSERAEQYTERGFTTTRFALSALHFRRYGMPFRAVPKVRVCATARACRAVVAARLLYPGRELAVLRTLQFAQFTSDLLLDEDTHLQQALRAIADIDAAALIAELDSAEVGAAYERDRAESRRAAGSAAALQGKTAASDGPERFTAPTVRFNGAGLDLLAGGFQPVDAYDVLIANIDPTLQRRPPAASALEALERFPEGLCTQEIAAIMAAGNEPPDRLRAEAELIELLAQARVRRRPLGDDALWYRSGQAQQRVDSVAAQSLAPAEAR
jgi:2-hydroxychromene-2-carboxylate isomerase